MDASRTIELMDWDKLEQSDTTCNFQAMRVDTKPGWGGGWNRSDLQNHDEDFLDNKKRLLNDLKAFGGFKQYNKGKSVEQPPPEKIWKAKKSYSHMTLITTEPQSFEEITKVRDQMSQRGYRVTTITALDRSCSQADPRVADSNGATVLSDTQSTSDSSAGGRSTHFVASGPRLGSKGKRPLRTRPDASPIVIENRLCRIERTVRR